MGEENELRTTFSFVNVRFFQNQKKQFQVLIGVSVRQGFEIKRKAL